VTSGLGYLEFELCKLFQVTPKELGQQRVKDPTGMAYMERTLIHRWETEVKARDEAERKAKTGKGKKNIRRK